MNLFLAIAIICFFILVVRKVIRKLDKVKIKLLCPFCDSEVAFIGLPSRMIYFLKNKEDQWLGQKHYAQVKLEKNICLICPHCLNLILMEKEKIE